MGMHSELEMMGEARRGHAVNVDPRSAEKSTVTYTFLQKTGTTFEKKIEERVLTRVLLT